MSFVINLLWSRDVRTIQQGIRNMLLHIEIPTGYSSGKDLEKENKIKIRHIQGQPS